MEIDSIWKLLGALAISLYLIPCLLMALLFILTTIIRGICHLCRPDPQPAAVCPRHTPEYRAAELRAVEERAADLRRN